MVKLPNMNEPLDKASTCMDWVKPHGKKKVAMPKNNDANRWCSMFRKKLNSVGGNENGALLNAPAKFKPKSTITLEAIKPSMALTVKLTPMI